MGTWWKEKCIAWVTPEQHPPPTSEGVYAVLSAQVGGHEALDHRGTGVPVPQAGSWEEWASHFTNPSCPFRIWEHVFPLRKQWFTCQ